MKEVSFNSQIGQDKWVIEEVFKGMNYGYFVELGGGDGVFLSNTYALEKHFNWNGLCIEPNEVLFEKLKNNRKCKVDNSFIYSDSTIIDFIQYGDAGANQSLFSSMFPYEHFTHIPEISKTISKKTGESLFSIFKRKNVPTIIHYLSLDVEGAELVILKDFFQKCKEMNAVYRIMCCSIEHNFREPDRTLIKQLMKENDFEYIKELFHDDLYVHKSLSPMI